MEQKMTYLVLLFLLCKCHSNFKISRFSLLFLEISFFFKDIFLFFLGSFFVIFLKLNSSHDCTWLYLYLLQKLKKLKCRNLYLIFKVSFFFWRCQSHKFSKKCNLYHRCIIYDTFTIGLKFIYIIIYMVQILNNSHHIYYIYGCPGPPRRAFHSPRRPRAACWGLLLFTIILYNLNISKLSAFALEWAPIFHKILFA